MITFDVVPHNDGVNQARLGNVLDSNHPSNWTPHRCANEADASLKSAFAWSDEDRFGTIPSAGASYLQGVVTDLLERISSDPDSEHVDHVFAAADAALSVYTHEQWDTFHSLTAWSEDLTELGGPFEDMTANATAAVAMIGERLGYAVLRHLDLEEQDHG